jgi:hypothetical protein
MMGHMENERVSTGAKQVLALSLALFWILASTQVFVSFLSDETVTDYWAIKSGAATLSYEQDVQFDYQAEMSRQLNKSIYPLKFPYPPHLLFLIRPLAWLPTMTGHGLFILGQMMLLVLGYYLVGGKRGWLALMAFQPLYQGLLLGQYFGVIFLGYALFLSGWWGPALAILSLKPQFAVFPLVWAVAQYRWRVLPWVLLIVLLVVLAFLWIGLDQVGLALRIAVNASEGGDPCVNLRSFLPLWAYGVLFVAGLVACATIKDKRLVLLLSVLLSLTVRGYDLVYLLLLIPSLDDLEQIMLSVSTMLMIFVGPPLFFVYGFLTIVGVRRIAVRRNVTGAKQNPVTLKFRTPP